MRYILALIIAVPLLTLSPWAFSGEVSSDTPTMERPSMVVGDTWISMDYDCVKPPIYVPLPDRVSGTGGRMFRA